MLAQAINTAHTSGVAASGCHHLNPVPLFHAGGLHALANPVLYFGGQVTVLARFVPDGATETGPAVTALMPPDDRG
jgi:fatty-acyl-CoA synthase